MGSSRAGISESDDIRIIIMLQEVLVDLEAAPCRNKTHNLARPVFPFLPDQLLDKAFERTSIGQTCLTGEEEPDGEGVVAIILKIRK